MKRSSESTARVDASDAPKAPPLADVPALPESRLHRIAMRLGPDLIVLGFFTLVFIALAIGFHAKLALNRSTVILPLLFTLVITAGAAISAAGDPARRRQRIREVLRDWAPFVALNFVYENLRMYTGLIRSVPIDPALDRLDRALFGVSPTLWMQKIQSPLVTDLMTVAYNLYFSMPLFLIALLYWRKRRQDFRELVLALTLCFYSGFLLFILFPAGPPRFYAPLMDVFDPPRLTSYFGLWELTQSKWDSVNPVKVYASFPSLHCAITAVTFTFAFRFRDLIARKWFLPTLLWPLCASLWFSTVYLRHHWVVDVFAGWALGASCCWAAARLRRLFEGFGIRRNGGNQSSLAVVPSPRTL